MTAVVLCSPLIRSYLINYARPLIYSTVMTHMNALAISKSFEMLEEGHADIVRRFFSWKYKKIYWFLQSIV